MINVKNLRKTYGEVVAVDDLSFEAAKGDILGFIGPNGAGKTTTLRMLACFVRPDSGSGTVGGFDISSQPVEVRRSLGYVSEKCPFYGEMTPRWFLKFVCDVRGINGNRLKPEIDRVAGISSLQEVMDRRIETLSKGFQRRLGLAHALLDDPPILLLDEPLSGLDPNQKQEIVEVIKLMAADKCFIISTHVMEELETLCNRVILINKGRNIADSTPQDFKALGQGTIDAYFRKLTREA
ncbi:MAG TPA: ABC transporter ATP-binding protein [Syntrophales bacterium]|nr:ABC transporter ATP-binding protein [Syntrophales bacterium]